MNFDVSFVCFSYIYSTEKRVIFANEVSILSRSHFFGHLFVWHKLWIRNLRRKHRTFFRYKIEWSDRLRMTIAVKKRRWWWWWVHNIHSNLFLFSLQLKNIRFSNKPFLDNFIRRCGSTICLVGWRECDACKRINRRNKRRRESAGVCTQREKNTHDSDMSLNARIFFKGNKIKSQLGILK